MIPPRDSFDDASRRAGARLRTLVETAVADLMAGDVPPSPGVYPSRFATAAVVTCLAGMLVDRYSGADLQAAYTATVHHLGFTVQALREDG